MYAIQILFTRQTWEDLHTWGGVAMVAAAVIHLAIHWPWVISMAKKMAREIRGQGGSLNKRGWWNLILNAVVALSFILTAASGVYFLFVPGGRQAADPLLLFAGQPGSDPHLGRRHNDRRGYRPFRHPLEMGNESDPKNGGNDPRHAHTRPIPADNPLVSQRCENYLQQEQQI